MNNIKKISSQNTKELNFSLLVLVLTICCAFLIVMATFTQLNIYALISGHLQKFNYVPQIPVIMFISGLLGKRYGMVSVIIYILTGLFLVPVFALGGGLDYILNLSFGYILAYIPAVFFSAKVIEKNTSLLNLILANITGVLIIHIVGVLYLSILLIIENESDILTWITNQTFNTILIDFMFGLFGIISGNFIKETLKKIA